MTLTLADRLNLALTRYAPAGIRGDKKALQRALEDRMGPPGDRPGTSYPSILGYFANRTTPSLDWLQAAAEAMEVRQAWLAVGQGQPTEEEERAWEARVQWSEEMAKSQREAAKERHGAILRAMKASVDYHPRHWFASIAEAEHRLGIDDARVGAALRAPLNALDIDPARMSDDTLNDYITSMVPVLLALANERTRQLPYTAPETED